MTTELYLVRHGESYANVDGVIGGITGDTGLTDRGRHQAERLGARLRRSGLRADRLVSSTLPRALETAAYVSAALGLDVVRDDELQELRPGEADALTYATWRERYPGRADQLWTDRDLPFAPGGESWAGFLARAGAGLSRLVDTHPDQTVVAVCHGGVINAAFHLAFAVGLERSVSLAPLHTSLTHWRHQTPDGHAPRWTLVGYNDAAHLVGDRVDGDLAST